MGVININNCLFIISDRNGAHEIEIKIGEGNLTYGERKPRTYIKDRGNLDTVRNADAEVMAVSFGFTWDYITSKTTDTVPTVEEALKAEGNADDWQTASDDPCEPYAVNVRVENDPNCGTLGGEIVSLPDFRYESLDHDVSAGTVACAGNCNVDEAVKTRNIADGGPVTGDTYSVAVANEITVDWTDPVNVDLERIAIVLSPDAGTAPLLPIADVAGEVLAEVEPGVETYTFTGLVTAETHYVSVWAIDKVGRKSTKVSSGALVVT